MAQKSFVFQVSSRENSNINTRRLWAVPKVALGSAGKDSSLRSDTLLPPGEKAVLKNISLQREGYAIYMTLSLQPSWKLAEEGSESLSIMVQKKTSPSLLNLPGSSIHHLWANLLQ